MECNRSTLVKLLDYREASGATGQLPVPLAEEVENLDSIVNFTICYGIAQSDDPGRSGKHLADFDCEGPQRDSLFRGRMEQGAPGTIKKRQRFEYAYVKVRTGAGQKTEYSGKSQRFSINRQFRRLGGKRLNEA